MLHHLRELTPCTSNFEIVAIGMRIIGVPGETLRLRVYRNDSPLEHMVSILKQLVSGPLKWNYLGHADFPEKCSQFLKTSSHSVVLCVWVVYQL